MAIEAARTSRASARAPAAPRLHGRQVLGLGAIFVAVIELTWRQTSSLRQVVPLNHLAPAAVLALLLALAAVEICGGVALLWPRSRSAAVRAGAWALAVVYLVNTLLTVPAIVAKPAVFDAWGASGEELSRLLGALIVGAMAQPRGDRTWSGLARAAYWAFAACVASFMGEQLAFFARTATLVPKWIPPGQVFWAAATTAFFGLGAAGLLWRSTALLSARLLAAMLFGFAALVWPSVLWAQPHVAFLWTEAAETVSIAGAAWVVADYVAMRPQ